MKYFLIILFFIVSATAESKEYPGYKTEKYLKKSKEERSKICTHMKNSYEEALAKECHSVLNTDTGKKSCLSGERLEAHIKQRKSDYEFTCQI